MRVTRHDLDPEGAPAWRSAFRTPIGAALLVFACSPGAGWTERAPDASAQTEDVLDRLYRRMADSMSTADRASRAQLPVTDGWHRPIVIVWSDSTVALRSAGPDGEMTTADDISTYGLPSKPDWTGPIARRADSLYATAVAWRCWQGGSAAEEIASRWPAADGLGRWCSGVHELGVAGIAFDATGSVLEAINTWTSGSTDSIYGVIQSTYESTYGPGDPCGGGVRRTVWAIGRYYIDLGRPRGQGAVLSHVAGVNPCTVPRSVLRTP